MNNKPGYEILKPADTNIGFPDKSLNILNCDDCEINKCDDTGCDIDLGCACGVNEMDCSTRVGRR